MNCRLGFNSRSPSGLRLWALVAILQVALFQFTQPKRAATCRVIIECAKGMFQFTQPKRAATVAAKIQQKRDSLKG